MPKLVLCLGFWICRYGAPHTKVATFSGFLDTKMQISSCYVVTLSLNFGYEDAELILPKLVLCLGSWI